MWHETTGSVLRVAALIALVSMSAGPATAKDKLGGEALRTACTGAFGDRDHFDWTPRMGIVNALATCNSALAQFPNDENVQFYAAVARDQWAERGGTQEDNVYATEVYRRLGAEDLQMAEYALGTMFDESSGVSEAEALSYMQRARAGEFGQSIRCEALRTFGFVDLEGTGARYDVAAAEQMAHGNYVCAGYLAGMYWSGYASPGDLPLPLGDYARYAAVHGDPMSMVMVGLFYAYGDGSPNADARLQGEFTATKDFERAGYWLLLGHWGTRTSSTSQRFADFWDGEQLMVPEVLIALQTALRKLGFYEGTSDVENGPDLAAAIAAFEASGQVDALFQQIRAKEKYDPSMGKREPMHLGAVTTAEAPAWTFPWP